MGVLQHILTGKRISNCQLIDRLSMLHVFGVDNCASGSHCSRPRTLLGNNGAITDHSKSVRSKRAIQPSIAARLNHCAQKMGIPFMSS